MNRFQRSFSAMGDVQRSNQQSAREYLLEAFQYHQSGMLAEAAQRYQKVLELEPSQPDALHLLGVLALEAGNPEGACDLISRSLEFSPKNADAHNNLGNALIARGDTDEASHAYRMCIHLDPNHADAHYNLANLMSDRGMNEAALAHYERTLSVRPAMSAAWFNRSNLLMAMGRNEQAVEGFWKALDNDPANAMAANNLGAALEAMKRYSDAAEAFRKAIAINPTDARAHNNLGNVLSHLGDYENAILELEEAIRLASRDPEIYINLGNAHLAADEYEGAHAAYVKAQELDPGSVLPLISLGDLELIFEDPGSAFDMYQQAVKMDGAAIYGSLNYGVAALRSCRLDEAVAFFEESVKRTPSDPAAHRHLCLALTMVGDVAKALEVAGNAVEVAPEYPETYSDLLWLGSYASDLSPEARLEEAQAWALIHAPDRGHGGTKPAKDKKLRVGFVARRIEDDFIGRALKSLVSLLDHTKFQTYLYIDQQNGDPVTRAAIAACDACHFTISKTDEEVVERIRQDEVDILIDLNGHGPASRIRVFSHRPAPIQAAWLGVTGTSGMRQFDFLIGDAVCLPAEVSGNYQEPLAHLPTVFAPCPFDEEQALAVVTAFQRNGHLTFGGFCEPARMTDETIRLWAMVLNALPDTHLLLDAPGYTSELARRRISSGFHSHGISESRLGFRANRDGATHVERYEEVDLVLDTFPFGIGLGAAEAIGMGVPVVTLPSDRMVGKQTESVLRATGHEDWIAASDEDFVAIVEQLARTHNFGAEQRAAVRQTLVDSPMCDTERFAKDFEALLRALI